MSRQPDIEKTLDQGVQIPRTSSTNWDIPVNDNWELLNNTIKRKFTKDSSEEQVIQGARTTVLSKFRFTQVIDGTSEKANEATKVSKSLTINNEQYDGSESKEFELVEKSDVQNTSGHIPRFTSEGHLLLPSGIEIW